MKYIYDEDDTMSLEEWRSNQTTDVTDSSEERVSVHIEEHPDREKVKR